MSQRCDCGRPFERLSRTTPDGHEYAVTGCPVCLDTPDMAEAFDAIVKAAHEMHAEHGDPPEPRE